MLVFLFLLFGPVEASDYPALDLINSTDLVSYFNDYLGFVYDSHGCLHFSPADIYLLSKTIPRGTELEIKPYVQKQAELTFSASSVPYLVDLIKNETDIKRHQAIFSQTTTQLVVYPSLGVMVVMVRGGPYAKVAVLAGPQEPFSMAQEVEPGQPVQWDFMLTTPTDPGRYRVLKFTDHYLSNAYYQNTIIPFGAWLVKQGDKWTFEENNKWYQVPATIVVDLNKPEAKRFYNYYDVNTDAAGRVVAARYAGHDFGQEVMLWTVDGKNYYPEMGYAAGVLRYEQIMLVKDLVHILTVPGDDDFDHLIAQNHNFSFYKELAEHKTKYQQDLLANADPRVKKAYTEYRENRLPRNQQSRYQALGLYHYLRFNQLQIDKQAYWYEKLKKDWRFWQDLRVKLRSDFDHMRILSLANRQNLVEGWLTDRLHFKTPEAPGYVKVFASNSYTEFFKPDEQMALFSAREKQEMLKVLQKTTDLKLATVDALNNYNFGVLLNDILGDLYKSHGCLHVSPRNSYFLFTLLPIGAQITIYGYDQKLSAEQVADVPAMADLVDFNDELEKLKTDFSVTSEVKVAVYPSSGYWVIYLKDKPLVKMSVRGGPKERFYSLQGRNKAGQPLFEDHLAYPSTPGNYRVFRKEENYLSSIYYDTTIIPMGGTIYQRAGKWVFQTKKGDWKELLPGVAADLNKPEASRTYTYYDPVVGSSGEVESVKWGSQPFGLYTVQTSKDGKTLHPELIHSSGDLIMEERQLVNELIKVLAASHDQLDDCLTSSQDFGLYKACYGFIKEPSRTDLIQLRERATYRLYFNLPLTSEEVAALPVDIIAANKLLRNQLLTAAEETVLVKEGVANKRSGKFRPDLEKIKGLQFDGYQYVVMIQKYAHHYEVLKNNWPGLSTLRQALLADFRNFVLRDPLLLHNFLRELMLKRTRLERLSQQDAVKLLQEMVK